MSGPIICLQCKNNQKKNQRQWPTAITIQDTCTWLWEGSGWGGPVLCLSRSGHGQQECFCEFSAASSCAHERFSISSRGEGLQLKWNMLQSNKLRKEMIQPQLWTTGYSSSPRNLCLSPNGVAWIWRVVCMNRVHRKLCINWNHRLVHFLVLQRKPHDNIKIFFRITSMVCSPDLSWVWCIGIWIHDPYLGIHFRTFHIFPYSSVGWRTQVHNGARHLCHNQVETHRRFSSPQPAIYIDVMNSTLHWSVTSLFSRPKSVDQISQAVWSQTRFANCWFSSSVQQPMVAKVMM
jgi:hypothetical protein